MYHSHSFFAVICTSRAEPPSCRTHAGLPCAMAAPKGVCTMCSICGVRFFARLFFFFFLEHVGVLIESCFSIGNGRVGTQFHFVCGSTLLRERFHFSDVAAGYGCFCTTWEFGSTSVSHFCLFFSELFFCYRSQPAG